MSNRSKRKRKKKARKVSKRIAEGKAQARKNAAELDQTKSNPPETLSVPDDKKAISEPPKAKKRMWFDWNTGDKMTAVVIMLALLAFFTPEVRCFLHMRMEDKCAGEKPPTTNPPEPPPGSDKKEDPVDPFKYEVIPFRQKGVHNEPILRAQSQDKNISSGKEVSSKETRSADFPEIEDMNYGQGTGSLIVATNYVNAKESMNLLLHRVEPKYPMQHSQATIVESASAADNDATKMSDLMSERPDNKITLALVVDEAGNVQHVERISGNPILVPAAKEAVRQWKFKPYVRDGKVVSSWKTIIEFDVLPSLHMHEKDPQVVLGPK